MQNRPTRQARPAKAAVPPAPVIHIEPAPVTIHAGPSTPKPPKLKFYNGAHNLQKLNEWTKQVERYFPAMDRPECMRHAAMYLEKEVLGGITGVRRLPIEPLQLHLT
jgi:hypothetical protein